MKKLRRANLCNHSCAREHVLQKLRQMSEVSLSIHLLCKAGRAWGFGRQPEMFSQSSECAGQVLEQLQSLHARTRQALATCLGCLRKIATWRLLRGMQAFQLVPVKRAFWTGMSREKFMKCNRVQSTRSVPYQSFQNILQHCGPELSNGTSSNQRASRGSASWWLRPALGAKHQCESCQQRSNSHKSPCSTRRPKFVSKLHVDQDMLEHDECWNISPSVLCRRPLVAVERRFGEAVRCASCLLTSR